MLLQAFDTLDERSKYYKKQGGASASATALDDAAGEFLARELLGLAKRLGGATDGREGRSGRSWRRAGRVSV